VRFNPKWAAICVAILVLAMLVAEPALAHTAGNSAGRLTAGFLHPLSGLDYLLAMLNVGICPSHSH